MTVNQQDFDATANKAIILGTADCLITIGYMGLAFIGENPTDEWIAEVIYGEAVPKRNNHPVAWSSAGKFAPKTFSKAFERLFKGL